IPIEAIWDGRSSPRGLRFRKGLPRTAPGVWVHSRFGEGIVTVGIGAHLRTSPAVDILVKAVPNVPKDGGCVLEGLVETDWFDGTFTINLKLPRTDYPVRWERGEPLCQLVPYPRGWLERFRTTTVLNSSDDPDDAAQFEATAHWTADRLALLEADRRG